jgi:hypothetical protein
MISQQYLHETFDYRDDGVLVRKIATSGPHGRIGTVVGFFIEDTTRPGKGYMATQIKGEHYCIHKLIWMWHHGDMPEHLDHIDRDTRNNRIENLRVATAGQNMCNRRKFRNNTSGHRGVSWHKRSGRWMAYVNVDKKRVHLGYFNDLEAAAVAASEARNSLHGQFATLN